MQRVVRSTFAGILAAAALVGCGDKVTVPGITTTPPDATIHSVTVTPAAASVAVGQKITLVASVDAGPAATSRTVTWSSSNTAVATVDATGVVTGVAAGSVSIIATATADATVKGASAVTVTGGNTNPPTVTISSINQTVCGANGQCNSVPANLTGAAGQLDVVLNVDTNGQQLKSVSATLTCPGNTTMTQSQTITAPSANVAAEAAAAPITLSFNTGLFNTTTGAPQLRNGQCSLAATATTAATTPQTATINTGLVLANADGVVISESFAGFTNAEGKTTLTAATDANGLPWKGGAVTVSALPVLYSGRTITGGGSITINLPGATNAQQVISPTAAGAVTATYSATASTGSRVTGLTLVSANYTANVAAASNAAGGNLNPCLPLVACEANGVTPLGVTPTIIALDNAGNDIPLVTLNTTQPALNLPNPTFRLDNTAPQPPVFFGTPGRQFGWVNAAYTFTGTGVNGGFSTTSGSAKYISCGDAAVVANATSGTGGYVCAGTGGATAQTNGFGQIGVGAAGVSGNSGLNGSTVITQYALSAGSYASINGNGTSTSSTTCSITGWTAVNTGGDLAEADASGNPFFVIRVFEADKLGNSRCVDLAVNPNASPNINTGAFAFGKLSVDKTAPTVVYIEPATDPTAAPNNGQLAAGGNIANFNVKLAGSDPNGSGFSLTPVTTMVTRLAMNPATGAASNANGNFNNTFACPTGLDNNNNCTTTALGFSNPGTDGVVTLDGTATSPGCAGCGYFTWTQTPLDKARNAATSVTGSVTPTIPGSFGAGAPAYRQVVVDLTAPTAGGIAVPASIAGGTSVSFATNAADNLDLVGSDFTVTYPAAPTGNVAPGGNFPIRGTGPNVGAAFDNVLTVSSSFNLIVPFFIRNVSTTGAANVPQNNPALPASIAMRVYDAAGNPSAVNPATNTGFSNIGAANVPQNGRVDFSGGAPANMTTFSVTNAAANISNCQNDPPVAPVCAGNVAPVNPTSVALTASASGNEGANFQFLNPFSQVQFYYFDTVSQEYKLIGAAVAPLVTDNATVTVRTFSWTLSPNFDPPAALGAGTTVKIIAVGVNAGGDALASAVNANITLTNP